ncbi:MAG: hypothetical protein IH934_07755 [Nanoarchaeota archaeon]|nr:hypothetical protein [Nanoarchaeota archaeon]
MATANTIDDIATGGAGHTLYAGTAPVPMLMQISRLYQQKPERFSNALGKEESDIWHLVDAHNIRDDALLNPVRKGINDPEDSEMHLELLADSSIGARGMEAYAKATCAVWDTYKTDRRSARRPANVSEVLQDYKEDGPLFRITWGMRQGRGYNKYTALMGEKDLAAVLEQLENNYGLLTKTVEKHFPKFVEVFYANGMPVPEWAELSFESTKRDYQRHLETVERRSRQASVSASKPTQRRRKKRFGIF